MSTYSCTLIYSLSSLSGGEEKLPGSLSSWEGEGEGNDGGKRRLVEGNKRGGRMETGEEEEEAGKRERGGKKKRGAGRRERLLVLGPLGDWFAVPGGGCLLTA